MFASLKLHVNPCTPSCTIIRREAHWSCGVFFPGHKPLFLLTPDPCIILAMSWFSFTFGQRPQYFCTWLEYICAIYCSHRWCILFTWAMGGVSTVIFTGTGDPNGPPVNILGSSPPYVYGSVLFVDSRRISPLPSFYNLQPQTNGSGRIGWKKLALVICHPKLDKVDCKCHWNIPTFTFFLSPWGQGVYCLLSSI